MVDSTTLDQQTVPASGGPDEERRRQLAEEARHDTEQRLRLALEAARMGTWEWKIQTGDVIWSEHVSLIFGFPSGQSTDGYKAFVDRMHPEDREEAIKAIIGAVQDVNAGDRYEGQFRVLWPTGELRWVEGKGRVLRDEVGRAERLIGVLMDITDRKSLEEQLLQSQKMESIGRLAGGVAHDFNNLVTGILGYAGLAALRLPPDSGVQSHLQQIQQIANRASSLVAQLLAFARKQILEPKVIQLNDLILRLDKLLRRVIGEDIELVTVPAPELDNVKVDANQLEQVLLNLAVNARDAMPNGGKLILETENLFLDEEQARRYAEVSPGAYVVLSVRDTGIGMSSAILSHIFEPFFTTKESGKGTGLGLATCYGILRQNGGHIWVESQPGQGSTFRLVLPRAEGPSTREPAQPTVVPRLPTGTETILLVEDEPVVRSIAGAVLRRQGYQILEAGHGEEALRVAAAHQGPLDLLLTDVVMPHVGGRQLAERLRLRLPGLPVLYMSGYTDDDLLHLSVQGADAAFLAKPFTASALAVKIREVLDRVAQRSSSGN